ncbi:GntR family transcriptional regulator [Anaeromicropila herbilytica]|uniref:GntR family transcriptional regulator n=1 Tax=Anaeromicropila herbilytica TaxID=2785025 RepID=A0A7R7ENZ9_9FIRM|nr:GntR family transcriptional regulator [Anaeromicropila herbilytica]BCN32249.1 GntR family transcriptional regulator [Anaeromicropila herbilytica]
MNRRQTKYYTIKQNIQNMINSGEMPIGSEIPSETELMNQYEVSRVTARRALDELYRDGYIEKIQGKRAYVKEMLNKDGFTLVQSYTDEIVKKHMIPSRRILECVVRKAFPEETAYLSIQEGDYVFSLIRIYYANGDPLCYTHSVLPYDYFNDIENHNFLNSSLYHIIENEYLVKIKSSKLSLKAVATPRIIANYLSVDIDTPILFTKAVTYGIIGDIERPIESFQTYYLTDNFEYTLTKNL